MKRVFLSLLVASMAIVTVSAQQISVVSSSGSTSMYQTLAEAIEGATNGSTIYLPGGGFQISDNVMITKRLSIIGVGHKAKSDNADGNTIISGSLNFCEGSSSSAVMGCYISGSINIGYYDGSSVNNVLVKYCNLSSLMLNALSYGTIINQNFIRNTCSFNNASVTLTNNIIHSASNIDGGTITNNIFFSNFNYSSGPWGSNKLYTAITASNSTVSRNIIIDCGTVPLSGSNCVITDNMSKMDFGDDCIVIEEEKDWNDVFKQYNSEAVTPASDFHFEGDYAKYENRVGIYAGSGFNDSGMAPVPYIVAKSIPEQTDAEGKLNIRIRVKASE